LQNTPFSVSGELEKVAGSMLSHAASISPAGLAARANVDWLFARDILQAMVKNGHARPLRSGRFAKPVPSAEPHAVDASDRLTA
jgi:hypothetical protein